MGWKEGRAGGRQASISAHAPMASSKANLSTANLGAAYDPRRYLGRRVETWAVSDGDSRGVARSCFLCLRMNA